MYRQVHDGIIWFKLPEAFKFSYYWNCNFMPVSLPNSSYVEKWIGELDIIMQMVNFTSSCKVLIYRTRGSVRPASLSFARTRLNFWYQSKFRMTVTVWNWSLKTVLLRGLQMWYKRNKCQFHWTGVIKTQQSLSYM